MSPESKVAAPAGGGLAEVLAVLAKATPGEWQHDRYAPCNEGRTDDPDLSLWADMGEADEQFIANIAFDITRPDDCDAICAAVNYLRSHGEAIGKLIAVVEVASAEIARAEAIADKANKIDRDKVVGRAAGRHIADIRAALAKVASNGASA